MVTGAFADEVRSAAESVDDVTIVFNPKWESGLASSLAAGLEVADSMSCDGALVMTTDQPLIDSAGLRALIDAFNGQHRIVASSYNGIVGVPAVFGAEHFPSLMKLTGDEGAGRWLRSRRDVTPIRLDNASIDIDTQADVDRLRSPGGPPAL